MEDKLVMGSEALDCGIKKSLINAGKQQVNYVDGTKVNQLITITIRFTLS